MGPLTAADSHLVYGTPLAEAQEEQEPNIFPAVGECPDEEEYEEFPILPDAPEDATPDLVTR